MDGTDEVPAESPAPKDDVELEVRTLDEKDPRLPKIGILLEEVGVSGDDSCPEGSRVDIREVLESNLLNLRVRVPRLFPSRATGDVGLDIDAMDISQQTNAIVVRG